MDDLARWKALRNIARRKGYNLENSEEIASLAYEIWFVSGIDKKLSWCVVDAIRRKWGWKLQRDKEWAHEEIFGVTEANTLKSEAAMVVRHLPPNRIRIAEMILKGYTQEETSRHFGMSLSWAKMMLKKTRDKLAKNSPGEGDDPATT